MLVHAGFTNACTPTGACFQVAAALLPVRPSLHCAQPPCLLVGVAAGAAHSSFPALLFVLLRVGCGAAQSGRRTERAHGGGAHRDRAAAARARSVLIPAAAAAHIGGGGDGGGGGGGVGSPCAPANASADGGSGGGDGRGRGGGG
eukprot:1002467-Pleurochrysis_carterae.AAC.2